MLYWQMSFADETQWLGGCCVSAENLSDAITKSHLLGCNPGGEILAVAFSSDVGVEHQYLNRPLSSDEMANLPIPHDAVVVNEG